MTIEEAYDLLKSKNITVSMVNHGYKIRVLVTNNGKEQLGTKDHTTKTILTAMDDTALYLAKKIIK